MTEQEFDAIKWQQVAHFTGGGHCEQGYKPIGKYSNSTLRKWVIVKYDIHGYIAQQGETRTRVEYEYNDKTYKSKKKLLEAINNDRGI